MSSHRSIACLFLGLASALGQDPNATNQVPPPPPGVPIPGVIPPPLPAAEVPPAIPAINTPGPENQPVAQAGVSLEDTKIVSDINEPKLSGSALAGLYRKYTGRRVIVTSAAAAEFAFVQEATPEDPLTYKEAANLLKKAAILEGYVFASDEQYPNLDILTLNAGGGIKPGNSGAIKIYNEKDILPEGDAVISYVMSLSYIKPEEAMNIFTQIIGQFGSYGSIAPVPNAAAIVITENASLIRKLIDLKKEIDKPSSQVATKFIKVQYADVTEIATTLTELLTAQQSTQSTAGIQRADIGGQVPPPGAPQGAGQAGGGGGEATPIQILPDPRTNRIFAMGRPVDIKFVEGLVREFDVETSEKTVLRRKLHFLKVAEFLPVASNALTRAFGGEGGDAAGAAGGAAGGGGGAAPRQSNNRQGGSSRQGGGGRNSNTTAGGGLGGAGGGGAAGGGGGGGESLDAPDASTAPESVLVGRTLLVADNITNSVIVNGPPSALEIIHRLLDQIDVRPDQVMISTVIGQLSLNDNISVGLDYLKLGNDFVARGGSGVGPALPIVGTLVDAVTGTPASGTPGTPNFIPAVPGRTAGSSAFQPGSLSGSGLQMYGRIGNNLNAYLTALQAKTDFTVLSRPSIFTANNQKGTISSGERLAIPTSSNSFNNGGASTNIEYQNVELRLEVVPLVNSDNEITMQISILNDERGADQVIQGGGSNGAPLTVPGITTRSILTTVTVPNNETVVLGGLITSRDNKSKSGIPILSTIPYLGALFGTNTVGKDRSELMVFMQPSIVQNDRSLQNVQADMDARYKISEKAHRFADGPGVLPPLDLIPLDEKESKSTQSRANKAPTFSEPEPERTTKPSLIKPSIRPAHRR